MEDSTVDLRTTETLQGETRNGRAYAILGACAIVGLAMLPLLSTLTQYFPHTTQQAPQAATSILAPRSYVAATPTPPLIQNPFSAVTLEANAAIVYDVPTGAVLYEKNGDRPHELASLTKLMTAFIVFEHGSEWDQVTVDAAALATEGDSGLVIGEVWRATDLAAFTLVTSSNDGAQAIANTYGHGDGFVDAMNAQAATLGLSSMVFHNPTGLDENTLTSGAYGTARDVAVLTHKTYHASPELVSYTTQPLRRFESLSGLVHDAHNTNAPLSQLSGLRASKTGFTDLAGGNLASLYSMGLGHEVVIVVLGSSIDGRFADTQTLYDTTREYLRSGWYNYERSDVESG